MIRVGVIGLGMMGNTHLDVYAKRDDVEVVAIADANPQRLAGEEFAAGNVEGQAAGGFDINAKGLKKYDDGKKLIRNKHVDLVDVCLPTPMHLDFARRALKAGKHVMVEKPVARTYAEAKRLLKAADEASGMTMVGMCMRFWPGWTWLKDRVVDKQFGDVKAATFRRVANHPGGAFYKDGDACGGALLDLHIHDVDFVQYLFGMPKSVQSVGYSKITDKVDHIVTRYEYDDVPIVTAEGGWAMAEGFGFSMQFTVNFDRATAVFDIGAEQPLMLYEGDKAGVAVACEAKMGYELEIDYFIDCIKSEQKPTTVTVEDAARSVQICEAEAKSVERGRPVKLS